MDLHELALMENLIDIIEQSARAHDISRITKVRIIVGKLTVAMPEALELAFQVLTRPSTENGSHGINWENAVLEIEEREVLAQCPECHKQFKVDDLSLICSTCNRPAQVISGRELQVDYFEGE